MIDNSKTLLALQAGLAAGATIGMLFAPEKGADTREKLNESLRDFGGSFRERAIEEINRLAEVKDNVVGKMKSKLRKAEEEFNDEIEHA